MRTRVARNISLPPDLKRLVEGLVRSGRYASESDVVSAALRVLEREEPVIERPTSPAPSTDSESEVRYREALAAGRLAVWETDFTTGIRQWTPEALGLFGLDLPGGRGQVGGPSDEWISALHPDDRSRAEAIYGAIRHTDTIAAEYRIRRPDGTTLWLSGNGKVTRRSPDGAPEKLVSIMADVTARKDAEEKLRSSEERFRALVAMSSDWFWEQNEKFEFVDFSESVETLAHSSVSSHIGKTRWQLPALDVSEAQWQQHRALLERHEPFRNFEYRRITEAGDVIWMTASGDPIFDSNGRFRGYRGIGTNITERKHHELLLDEQRRLLELIATDVPRDRCLAALTDAVARLDPGARSCVLIAKESGPGIDAVIASKLPLSFGEQIGAVSTIADVTCSSLWRELCSAHDIRAFHSMPIFSGDGRNTASFHLCFDAERSPTPWELRIAEFGAHIASIAIERSRTAAALAAKSRELTRILDTAATGLARFDHNLTLLATNRTFAEIVGCPLDDIIGLKLDSTCRNAPLAAMRPWIERALAGERVELEAEVPTNSSSKRLHALMVPDADERGTVVGIVASITDVTESRRAEAALRARDALLRSIAERARLGVYMIDSNMRYTYANPAYLEFLGLEPRDVTGVAVADVVGAERLEEFRAPYERALAGATVTFERAGAAPGATREPAHWRLVSLQPFADSGGHNTGVIGIVLDITERKRMEERQDLLLRELAHRGKNLLAVIQSIARQTFDAEADIISARRAFIDRLQSLSRTYSVLTAGNFEGAPLSSIVENELGAMAGRLTVTGPRLVLNDRAAQTFALVLHELATNALKHGAWSVQEGGVVADWHLVHENSPQLVFTWREQNGPSVAAPKRQGFGSLLIRDVVASQFEAIPEISFEATGLVYRFSAPLRALEMQVDPERQRQPDGAFL
jgi:PAS domain S-box-containing protein